MMELVLFCMASVGLTAILVDGKIFQPVRNRIEDAVRKIEHRRENSNKNKPPYRTWTEFFWELITCYQCCGFWSGLFCGLFLVERNCSLNSFSNACDAVFMLLICGLSGSFLSTFYLMLVEWFFAKTMLAKRTNTEQTEFSEHSEN